LIPISKVDENMQKAQKRNACLEEKFWFRRNFNENKENNVCDPSEDECDGCELWTINEIINGKDNFPGLVRLINQYLASMEVDTDTHCSIQQYLKFLQRRASGSLLTTASWIRREVLNHPDYK
jgi:glutamate--cysteine ligase catalytic subunit